METNPVNKAFITTTNDVIVPNSQDSTYSSSLYSQDSAYSSSLSMIARFDILIFSLLSNRETRHTRLRSHREIWYTHLRSQMARFDILIFTLIARLNSSSVLLIGVTFGFETGFNKFVVDYILGHSQLFHQGTSEITMTRFITIQWTPTSRKINAIKMRRCIDLNFAQSMRRSIWISLHKNATIHRLEFRFIKMRQSIWISLHQNATMHRFELRFLKMRRYIDLNFATMRRYIDLNFAQSNAVVAGHEYGHELYEHYQWSQKKPSWSLDW